MTRQRRLIVNEIDPDACRVILRDSVMFARREPADHALDAWSGCAHRI
jgi:hypothetical protein